MNGGPLPEHVLHGQPDLTREPFADDTPPPATPPGSVTRPVGAPPRGVDPATGERQAWPPRTQGPLPQDWQELYPDVNVQTALDELDLWAAELDRQSVEYARYRRELGRARHAYEKAAAIARRRSKSSPETGRRTVADLDAEVTERTDAERAAFYDAEAACDAARQLMYAAKDQMERLRSALSVAKVLDPRGP